MKTSDKLILLFFTLVLAFFGAIHLTLYAQLRQGHTYTNMQPEDGWARPYEGKAPALLVLEGNINVTLTPSDSFFVEVQKEGEKTVRCRLTTGDSLLVKGDTAGFINPHGPFQTYNDRPWVSVHMGRHTAVRLRGVLALLKGNTTPGGAGVDLHATNTQLWIGEFYAGDGTNYTAYHYDSLSITASNTNLVLHSNASIGHLSASLDDKSSLNDQHANIGTIDLQYTPLTKIGLTGINLDKLPRSGH